MFDKFIGICCVVIAIGCVLAVKGGGMWSSTYTIFAAPLCTIPLVLIFLRWNRKV